MLEYSKGLEAHVYETDPKQKLMAPYSDLVRVDRTRDITLYARLFYQHKIAELLFPGNFIQVTGTQSDLPVSNNQTENTIFLEAMLIPKPVERTIRLFSRLAPVPQEHAVYASHFTHGKFGGKEACECPGCSKHAEFHKTMDLQRLAWKVGEKTAAIGIFAPTDDASDYCYTGQGIVFFEIDSFNSSMLADYLLNQKSSRTPQEEYALQLLNRYCELELTGTQKHHMHSLTAK